MSDWTFFKNALSRASANLLFGILVPFAIGDLTNDNADRISLSWAVLTAAVVTLLLALAMTFDRRRGGKIFGNLETLKPS